MTFNINTARADTPACENIIHFNNAGAALMPLPVSHCLHDYLNKEQQFGGYETADKEQALIDNFYHAHAMLLNCQPSEIAFAENATRALNMAFYSFTFKAGDRILTTLSEYGSNIIAYLHHAKRFDAEVVFVPNDEFGQIDTQALKAMIDERVKLITISHIPTGGGLVNPAAEIGRIANAANIPFLLDAAQSIGQIPLDVKQLGCDILVGTGRKYLRGPRATGVLYVRQGLLETLTPPLIDQYAATLISPTEYTLRNDAKRFETWEQNLAYKAALGVAVDYALAIGLESIQQRIYHLAALLRAHLSGIDGVQLTDDGIEKCGIVTFFTQQANANNIKQQLAAKNINVTTPQGSGNLVSFEHRGLSVLVRASVHYYNTENEIDTFIKVLKRILSTS